MDVLDQSTLVTSAARLVGEHYGDTADMDNADRWAAHLAQTKALEIGLVRRKIELYERMMLDGTSRRGSVWNDPDQTADLLAGARARLAELETQL